MSRNTNIIYEHTAVEDIATTFTADYARQNKMQTETNLQWFNALKQTLTDHFNECAKRKPHSPIKVLEIGCGSGIFAYELARNFPNVMVNATDISESLIAGANQTYKLPNLTYEVKDSTKLNIFNHYDLVIGLFMAHFVKDKVDLMRRLAHSLVPSGQIRLITPLEDEMMLKMRQEVFTSEPWNAKNKNRYCISGIEKDNTSYTEMLTQNEKRLANGGICEKRIRHLKMTPENFERFLSGIALEIRAIGMTDPEASAYCKAVCERIPKREDGTVNFDLQFSEIAATRRLFEPESGAILSPRLSLSRPLCVHYRDVNQEAILHK